LVRFKSWPLFEVGFKKPSTQKNTISQGKTQIIFQIELDFCVKMLDFFSNFFGLYNIRPDDRREAHGARVAGGIQLATRKIMGSKEFACFADSVYFSMGCGVVVFKNTVAFYRDDAAIFDHNRSEGATISKPHSLAGLVRGGLHEALITHGISLGQNRETIEVLHRR
jgi:hypothetical protein